MCFYEYGIDHWRNLWYLVSFLIQWPWWLAGYTPEWDQRRHNQSINTLSKKSICVRSLGPNYYDSNWNELNWHTTNTYGIDRHLKAKQKTTRTSHTYKRYKLSERSKKKITMQFMCWAALNKWHMKTNNLFSIPCIVSCFHCSASLVLGQNIAILYVFDVCFQLTNSFPHIQLTAFVVQPLDIRFSLLM